ncbi:MULTISPECIES: hypothetical protein [Streptomyces]|uniref:hypothetical protein n=1 Tax=Streptomyces TaxID=1883 RepID=UPI00163C65DD|nr:MULTISPECIES: hypothetical protein [Streptomyces]MBC2874210.1 hypothetical protein [Streptomyces sp. TYQ1024]UBI40252.1 hypothetical protein K7I03_29900 [Streptomyces mobaraensis]UKW32830.1 hypothetical protein MCU78_29825 [Streptomyces sp. TYQ1024]
MAVHAMVLERELAQEVDLALDVVEAMTPTESPVGDAPSFMPMSALGLLPKLLGPEEPKDPA